MERGARRRVPTVGDLCRMDAVLVDRIARGEDLWPIVAVACAVIAVGGGLYGFAFGLWRSLTQGLISAAKLPLLLLAVVACSVLINGLLAIVLRTRLDIRQSAVAVLLSLAITAAILGAFSPVAVFFVSQVPPPLVGIVGLEPNHPDVVENLRVAQLVLAFHVAVIAVCGVVGNVRLFQLLAALTGSRASAGRLMASWLAIDGFVGAQLSWLLRPFLCKPNLEPQVIRPDAFDGNFFEELWRIVFSQAPDAGSLRIAAAVALAMALLWLGLWALSRSTGRQRVWATVGERGLDVADVTGRKALVPFDLIGAIGAPAVGVIGSRAHIDVELTEELAFLKRRLRLEAGRVEEAALLRELLSNACARVGLPKKPYR